MFRERRHNDKLHMPTTWHLNSLLSCKTTKLCNSICPQAFHVFTPLFFIQDIQGIIKLYWNHVHFIWNGQGLPSSISISIYFLICSFQNHSNPMRDHIKKDKTRYFLLMFRWNHHFPEEFSMISPCFPFAPLPLRRSLACQGHRGTAAEVVWSLGRSSDAVFEAGCGSRLWFQWPWLRNPWNPLALGLGP